VNFLMFVLTLTPYGLIILSKYIMWGKFYIFKIEEEKIIVGEEKIIKKRMSQSEYDSMIRKEKEQNEKKVKPTEQELYETNIKKHFKVK
jgi:hypothetical protein